MAVRTATPGFLRAFRRDLVSVAKFQGIVASSVPVCVLLSCRTGILDPRLGRGGVDKLGMLGGDQIIGGQGGLDRFDSDL